MLWPVSAKAVILRDGCVLLARNGRGEWELPGGRVERGEALGAAAIREVAEETGLLVEVAEQLGIVPFEVVPGQLVLVAAFVCVLTEERELVLSEEHDALRWQPVTRLGDLPLPPVYRDFVSLAVRGRVVLVGDSHLAKLNRSQVQELSFSLLGRPLVVNHAMGGSSVIDLLTETRLGAFLPQDRFVVSVGTNDYAPWKRTPLPEFRSAFEEVLQRLHHHRLVVLQPPPVDPIRQVTSGRENLRAQDDRAPYAAAVEEIVTAHGAQVIALPDGTAIGDDGVHLSSAGNELLLARLAQALDAPS